MQIRIDEMTAKQIDTQRGPATLVNIKSAGQFYSTFSAKWNSGWSVGDTVEAEVEINGKYKNLKPPAGAVQKGSDFAYKIQELETRISRLEGLLAQQAAQPKNVKVYQSEVFPASGAKIPMQEPPPFDDSDMIPF